MGGLENFFSVTQMFGDYDILLECHFRHFQKCVGHLFYGALDLLGYKPHCLEQVRLRSPWLGRAKILSFHYRTQEKVFINPPQVAAPRLCVACILDIFIML